MGLSKPQMLYGVHSLTLYNRETFEPYGIIKVIGSLSTALSGQFNDIFGGSSRYAWDSEPGVIDSTLTGTIKELPNFAFEKFLGASVTENAAETAGNVGTLTNKKGTSIMSATTGIASAEVKSGSEADLKSGLYVVKAISATTVNIYCMSDYDFSTGTDKEFQDDDLSLLATAITITASEATELTGFGLTVTGGSGTIAFEVGDTAYFYVRKVNSGSDIISVGAANSVFPEFGAIIASQQRGNGDTFETQFYRCQAIGLPVTLNEQDWLNADITIKALYDSTEGKVMSMRRIRG